MSETPPEGGFTLDFIGLAILEMRGELRDLNQRVDRLEHRFEGFASDVVKRFQGMESAIFRLDTAWRETHEEIQRYRSACEEAVYHLRRAEAAGHH